MPLPSTATSPLRLRASARGALLALATAVALIPGSLAAQAGTPPATAGPLLAPFAAGRVAIVPVQLWRADTSGWSQRVNWAELRLAIDSAITTELHDRGMGRRWAYAEDVVRSAKRNPTYATDPYALGVARWRNTPPKAGEELSSVLADNLRPLTALGDTRFALIPVELRAEGDAVVLRLVLADTRGRSVVWAGDLLAPGGAGMAAGLATRVADLVIEP